MRTLSDLLAVRQVATPGAYSVQADLTWIHVQDFRRILFVCNVADLTDDCVLTVKQATDDSGTGSKALDATVTATFANGTDESKPGLIEVLTDHLDDTFDYVTLNVNPAASTTLSIVALLGQSYENPVPNAQSDGVAFKAQSAPA